ncbi:MAG: type VI secretion system tip protein TssI/VgrG [Pyrinomonadaceae bacterium]
MANYTQENRLLRITSPAFDDDFLLMNSMTVSEGISQLYEMRVELLHEEPEGFAVPDVADHKSILGQPVSIEATQIDGQGRKFNGIVSEFARGSRGGGFTNYSMRVVPKVWIATQIIQSRIFQQKSVPSILMEVFAAFEGMVVWEFDYDYKARNYCVQYRESDFAFASRLMEEEGIYYYFEHVEDRHTMIVSDKPRFTKNCPGNNQIMFTYRVSDGEFQTHIREWDTEYKLQSGVVSYRDHHIQQPNKKLGVTSSTKFQISDNANWEVYDFPGGYGRKFDGVGPSGDKTESELGNIIPDGNRVADNTMGILDAQFELSKGEGDVASFTSGHKFSLTSHPIEDQNGEYVLVSIQHTARQSPAYGKDSPEEEPYLNEFTVLAHGRAGTVPFRPARVTPKPLVYGAQTAYVVGPDGEEIYTDEYGRIKVQFHWDRDGKTDGSDSCWLPVAQTWSGNGWGSMFIPRIGMEVIVHFLEGNPDSPIVDGCVYHPMNMPPYKLPTNKTRSGIKTDSSTGGNGYNELRFEDKKGEEQIFVHGEKDLDVRIKNDRREWTGKDQHLIVVEDLLEKIGDSQGSHHLTIKDDQKIKIGAERHVKVGSNEAIEIGGSQTIKISGDQGIKVTGAHSTEATSTMYLKGMSVVVEGMTQLSLKVGGNFVDINSGGVFIKGTMVMINSGGAAGSGSAVGPCPPTAPDPPDEADNDKPGKKMQLEKQSYERKKAKSSKEDPKKKSWIKLKMVDEEGKPVPSQAYEVKTSDGKIRKGSLNSKGEAHIKGIEPGNCDVSFPNLDKDAWEDA